MLQGVIRIRISKKDKQHNGQKKKYKRTNNDQQSIYIKLKIALHEPHYNPGIDSGRVAVPAPLVAPCQTFFDGSREYDSVAS
jgi:hypothetical protein